MIEKVKLILPNIRLQASFYKRSINVCLSLFEDKLKIDLQVYSNFEITFDNDDVVFLESENFILEGFEHVVCIYGYDIPPIENFTKIKEEHFFWLNNNFQITTPNGKFHPKLTPNINKHFFNNILPNEVSAFGYFPYIDIMRDQRLKPINSFGFRIDERISENNNKTTKEKIIVILGGSTAQGINVNFQETFGYLLEKKLNQNLKTNFKFKILNFALSGQIVTDEFITFFSFCEKYTPDLVITFDGLNDFINGCFNDPYLMNNWMFAYKYQHEERALFFNRFQNEVKKIGNDYEFKIKNEINVVVDSYLYRLNQLHTYIKAKNIKSLICLQPYINSKKELSNKEISFLEESDQAESMSPLLPVIKLIFPKLYKNVQEKFEKLQFEKINFHKLFRIYGKEIDLFSDRVHFSQGGEKIVAEKLFLKLKSIYKTNFD
ncbi:MAG: hypothetical protein CMC82_08975 [Flavobacteriaceae bacterium]|nr:hypothetical protein [Flavobacteriaceae bacterium]